MQSFGVHLGRGLLYFLLVVVVCQLISLEGYSQLTESVYGEASLTEKLQIVFSGICCALFLMTARMSQKLRPAAVMLAALTGMMLVRESDAFLDKNVFDGAWQALVLSIMFATAIYLKKQPDPITPSVEAFIGLPSSGMLMSGFLVTFVFSRLFGRRSFWEAVMGEGYIRAVKNIVEEGTELVGYSLILIAAAELVWYSKSHISQRSANKETEESLSRPEVGTNLMLTPTVEGSGLQKNASLKIYAPSQAEDKLVELVQRHGLSEEEAVELVDMWRHKIFQHSSKRAA